MTSEFVFVDTVALIALSSGRDGLHSRAIDFMKRFRDSGQLMVTSEWVLSKYMASGAAARSRRVVLGVVEAIMSSRQFTVVEASHAGWQSAFELYRDRIDKAWSHVDCSSMLICRQMSVRRVFTNDHHFAQAGFEVLLA